MPMLKNNARLAVPASAIAALLSGCTTSLTSVADVPSPAPVAGIAYNLPELRQNVTVTWRLAECQPMQGSTKKLKFEVEASQAGTVAPGPGYVIDPETLVAYNKIGSFKVAYQKDKDGKVLPYLKSINVDVEDRSPQIISGLVGFGFNVARIAMGLPSGTGGAVGVAAIPSCSDNAQAALKTRETLTADLGKIRAEAKKLTEEAEKLSIIAAARALDAQSKRRIGEIASRSVALTELLAVTNKSIAKADKVLAIAIVIRLPASGNVWSVTAGPAPADFNPWIQQILGEANRDSAKLTSDLSGFVAHASLKPASGMTAPSPLETWVPGTDRNGAPVTKPAYYPGVLYRTPAPGKLLACARSVDPAADVGSCNPGETELVNETVAVPQFGQYRVLTLTNKFGEKAGIEAVFAADGSLETYSYGKTASGAEALAKLLESSSGSAVAFATQARAKNPKLTDLATVQASNDLKKAQLEALDYDAKLAAARNPLPPTTETKQAAAGVAVLNLQLTIQDTIDLAGAGGGS